LIQTHICEKTGGKNKGRGEEEEEEEEEEGDRVVVQWPLDHVDHRAHDSVRDFPH
jgi:hypothetical protein